MSRDTNFYYSFLVLPPRKRHAIIAVWDFCRAVDDAVDEQAEIAPEVALDRWRSELAAAYEGRTPSTPSARRLQPFIDRFHLPREAFEAVINGVAMDIGTRRYETFDELYEYCYRVASAVGLICVEIFGYQNPQSRQYAVELGIALQLTNILRDIPADLARGRLYVPLEDLTRFGCREEDLKAGPMNEPVRSLLASQARRARTYYDRAAAALPKEDAVRLVAAEIMRGIYEAVLRRIERDEYDVFTRVARVPRPVRARIAAATWLQTLLRAAGRHRLAGLKARRSPRI